MYDVIIIGGGISGCILATKLKHKRVLIIEANDKLMKKIYATGNGRCNITNKYISVENYNTDDKDKLKRILKKYDNQDFLAYLHDMGLRFKLINDGYYPRSLQATSFIEKIEKNVESDIKLNENVLDLKKDKEIYIVKTDKSIYKARNIVYALGSKASNINKYKIEPYKLIKKDVINPLPCLCGLLTDKKYIKKLKGLRVDAKATLRVSGVDIKSEVGNVQFIEKGISGIVIFQLSSQAIRNIDLGNKVTVSLNYMYDIDRTDLEKEIKLSKDINEIAEVLYGYLPFKLVDVLIYLAENKKLSLEEVGIKILNLVYNHEINIVDSEDYKKAQTCSGGVRLKDLSDNLADSGAYYIGELVNVDGICGGYNIQWAYSSASEVASVLGRS